MRAANEVSVLQRRGRARDVSAGKMLEPMRAVRPEQRVRMLHRLGDRDGLGGDPRGIVEAAHLRECLHEMASREHRGQDGDAEMVAREVTRQCRGDPAEDLDGRAEITEVENRAPDVHVRDRLQRDVAKFEGHHPRPAAGLDGGVVLPEEQEAVHLERQCAAEPAPVSDALGQGLRFGAAVAAIATLPGYLIYYAVQPLPASLVGKQLLYGTIATLLLGLLLAWLNPGRKTL